MDTKHQGTKKKKKRGENWVFHAGALLANKRTSIPLFVCLK
jgi:hypothetical protein